METLHRFKSPKTLFMTADSGTAIRNLFRTDVYTTLRRCENLRIVLFTPLVDEDFKNEVGGANVVIEPFPAWKPTALVGALRSLRKDIWSEKFELQRFKERRAKLRGRLSRWLVFKLWVGDKSPASIDKAVLKLEKLERRLTPPLGKPYFDKYNPDLVVYSTLYAKNLDIEIAAQQQRVKSCAYIMSWDNPTTKGPFPVRPDRAIVWNNIMKEEVVSFHDMNPQHVFVSGPPQFDIYKNPEKYGTKAAFFQKWGLDLNKKLITYTTGSHGLFPFEPETTQQLYDKIKAGAFKEPCQLLVRLHPKDNPALYTQFEGLPELVLQQPGRRGKTDDNWNPTLSDMYDLGETIYFSDVMVNIASTLSIEASCFNKPIVNLAWDGFKSLPPDKSCERIYGFNHYRKIVETGGVKIAYNIDEAVQLIQRYLDNPELEAAERMRIRDEQCYNFDGKSGERIGRYIIDLLEAETL